MQLTKRYQSDGLELTRDGLTIIYGVRSVSAVQISLAERDALMARIANLLNADEHARQPLVWASGDGSSDLERQAKSWTDYSQVLADTACFGIGAYELRRVDTWEGTYEIPHGMVKPLPRRPGVSVPSHAVDAFKIAALTAALEEAIQVVGAGVNVDSWHTAMDLGRGTKVSRDTLEEMCRQHHGMRTRQGFTTAPWAGLEERNRDQYRSAMRAALAVLGVTCE